jgi:hypothetical protein
MGQPGIASPRPDDRDGPGPGPGHRPFAADYPQRPRPGRPDNGQKQEEAKRRAKPWPQEFLGNNLSERRRRPVVRRRWFSFAGVASPGGKRLREGEGKFHENASNRSPAAIAVFFETASGAVRKPPAGGGIGGFGLVSIFSPPRPGEASLCEAFRPRRSSAVDIPRAVL